MCPAKGEEDWPGTLPSGGGRIGLAIGRQEQIAAHPAAVVTRYVIKADPVETVLPAVNHRFREASDAMAIAASRWQLYEVVVPHRAFNADAQGTSLIRPAGKASFRVFPRSLRTTQSRISSSS